MARSFLTYADPSTGNQRVLYELWNDGANDNRTPYVVLSDGSGNLLPVDSSDGVTVTVKGFDAAASLAAGTNLVGKFELEGQAVDGANRQQVSVAEFQEEYLSQPFGIFPLGIRRDTPSTWSTDGYTSMLTLSSRGALWCALDGDLPAGTNRVGGVAIDTEKVQHGSSQLTLKAAAVSVTGSSEEVLVAAVGGKKIRVHSLFASTTVSTQIDIKSNTTVIVDDMPITTFGQYGGNAFPGFLFETAAGEDLRVQAVSGSAEIVYFISYTEV